MFSLLSSSPSCLDCLSQRVFFNCNLSTSAKVAVDNAVCVTVRLYGCEAWVLYRRHIKALEAFHIRCLQWIFGLRWWHKVTM